MRSGLLVTHYSLLAIAITSSCCLFYLVASENAKTAATIQLQRHASAADVSLPLHVFKNVDVSVSAATGKISKSPSTIDTDRRENGKILREYKKLEKKRSTRQDGTTSSHTFSTANIFLNKKMYDVYATSDSVIVSENILEQTVSSFSDDNADIDKSKNLKSVENSDTSSNRNDNSVVNKLRAGEADSANDITRWQMEMEDHKTNKMDKESLPNIITDIPAVTVTELPIEVLQPMQSSLNAIMVETSNKKTSTENAENRTVDILETKDEKLEQQGDEIIKINDSGGGIAIDADSAEINAAKITASISSSDSTLSQTLNVTATAANTNQTPSTSETESTTAAESSGTVNLTNEEVPMPVFSEWAQKQMEAAEKQQQAKEQEVVNTIAQKKNLTNGNKKLPPLKMRAKNYASPDCGAKIITSNADATNTGAVLSSSKDEYMLSPCGNRIWFVVELCEAIQAQKVDLANFELFSSSPKNFTVAVSNRFPTRDWSNVGRFIAEDKRNVQSFDLHPHLFGKFVRVDIHSHHSQEHFCPVSLFRVFGTSEIEAFETENHPDDDLDDFEDELYGGGGGAVDQANVKNTDNIFKSASDAVLSIVKKAAEVLVKPSNIHNRTLSVNTKGTTHHQLCRSFVYGEFSCSECSPTLVERVNNLLSCKFRQLENLLSLQRLRSDLLNTHICTKNFGVDVKALNSDCSLLNIHPLEFMASKNSYFLNLLPEEYIGALCYILSGFAGTGNNGHTTTLSSDKDNEVALNLTIDKKLTTSDFKALNDVGTEKKVTKPQKNSDIKDFPKKKLTNDDNENFVQMTTETPPFVVTSEASVVERDQLITPPDIKAPTLETTTTPLTKTLDIGVSPPTPAPDVNIYNLPHENDPEIESKENPSSNKANIEKNAEAGVKEIHPSIAVESLSKNEEDVGGNIAWETFDTLLPTTVSPGINIPPNQGQNVGGNMQQKITGAPQSESIFIRLSNRIKALERNMSLSGQYLEELSRRYKKQVEELQQVLTQQSQTVRNLEEQNRRHIELQELYERGNILLKNELDNMALQVHACIVVIIVVGGFVLLLLVISILFFRAIWRRNKAKQIPDTLINTRDNSTCTKIKTPSRRKSYDEYSDHGTEKLRRPSEEVTDILKKHLEIPEKHKNSIDKTVQTQPQRKMSVCYGNSTNQQAMLSQETIPKTKNPTKRKNAKSSWTNSYDIQQMALERLENMRGMDVTLGEYKQILEAETSNEISNEKGNPKNKLQHFLRQESAPAHYMNDSGVKKPTNSSLANEYCENVILDEEDLDNFIPNSDLAYNEFMPEGPSGYQITVDGNDCVADGLQNSKGNEKPGKKKSRRISSPGFFKTSISKALTGGKNLGTGRNGNSPVTVKTPHSSATSWEWHRLKNSNLNKNSQLYNSPSSVELLRSSPTGSLDASTLSEIHFPTNSTENSFRILEEAILSSGETLERSPTTVTKNGKQSNSATSSLSGGSNSSQRSSNSNSTSSSTAQKKQRGFHKIFRKVF